MARAERKKEPLPEAPPPAQPLAVKVSRGEPFDIPLRIYGQKNEPLKYVIRTPPVHGRLTEPRVVGREISAVTYTPPADLAITRDQFSYAVQNRAGVSAAVDVVITIVDLPPRLALPGALDFSSVLAGAVAAQPLEISNSGGGIAEGRAEVAAPWKIDGPVGYRLGAGAHAVFRVVFAPEQAGTFENAVRFSSQPETSVPVRGAARAALAVQPAQVVLQHAAGDPVRTGSFEITNQADAARRVTLSGGGRLQIPADLAVPAHGTVRVPVQTAAGDVAALEGEVRVEAPGLTLRVPVRAAPVAAIVRAGRELVAFGRVDATQAAGASLELENIGGTTAGVSLAIAPPFVLEQATATLSPGEKKTLALRTQPAAAGKYRARLTVQADRQQLEIPVEAELVAASAPAPNPVPVGPSSSEPAPQLPAPEETPVVPGQFPGELRVAIGVKLTDVRATGATLEWPAAMSEATQFRVERRGLVADESGGVKFRWDELPGVTFRREGDRHVALLRGLQPATVYALRVVPLGPDPEASQPLFLQNFTTPQAGPGLWSKVTPLRVLLAVLVLCAALLLRQRRAERRRP